MSGYVIGFDGFPWEDVSPGLRQKVFVIGKNRMRLLELAEGFEEKDWCEKAHAGYLLEGEVTIKFSDKQFTMKAGEGLYISGGEKSKHMASVARGGRALLVLFEDA